MAPRYRAIQFREPQLLGIGHPAGMTIDPTGALATIDGDQSVRQAILLLLATRPGERVMRPMYGSHLHRLVFEPNDATAAGLAIHYVRDAIARWEPRVVVLDVDARADGADPSRLLIELTYRVRSTNTVGSIIHVVEIDATAPTEETP